MSEIPKGKNHTLMLDARGKLMLTGAEDVSGFNEETVSVLTSCGRLIIKTTDELKIAFTDILNRLPSSDKYIEVKVIGGTQRIRLNEIIYAEHFKPVSYTHLDVYKRQRQYL